MGTDTAWPAELRPVLEGAVTAEYATLTRSGRPVTVPTTPYVDAAFPAAPPTGSLPPSSPPDPGAAPVISISTGLTYPAKAERARRRPTVSLLFADPVGSPVVDPPVVLVQGLATVRDADLQANLDRYQRLSSAKLPDVYRGMPDVLLRRLTWYFARIWVEVTPLRIRWWASRAAEATPGEWRAPEGTSAPASDPAPPGGPPAPWLPAPPAWQPVVRDALARLPQTDLTVVEDDGFPATYPVTVAGLDETGLEVAWGGGVPDLGDGPASLTWHAHPASFSGQENRTVVGRLTRHRTGARLEVERALADWSLAGNRLTMGLGFLATGRKLAPRLRHEAARRDQPVPRVRLTKAALARESV